MQIETQVKLAQRGEKDSFIWLVKHYEATLYRVAKAILKHDEDCADAIQETILKAYQALHSLKEATYFKTWITRILINECNQILRQKRKVIPIKEFTEKSFEVYENIELQDAVEHLDDDLRTVVTLYYFEDLPVKLIAELLNLSEGTVKSRLHRARQSLSKSLQIQSEGCQ